MEGDLRSLLDKLYVLLSRRYLSSSMLEPVRRWYEAGYPASDVEVLALTAALYDFQMRVATIKRNFSLLLEYLSSRGLFFRDLSDPGVSSRAVEYVRGHNVGFFHRFDKYGLALPVIVSAACKADLRNSAMSIVEEVRQRVTSDNEVYLGLGVARGLLARLWSTRVVRDALSSGSGAAKTLNLILPRPYSTSLLKRMNLFLRWLVRDEYPDLGLWNFIMKHELVVPLDSSIARVCGRLIVGKALSANNFKSLRVIMDFLRKINPEDPIKYDFVLSRPAILGWCKKDLLQSDCDVCPLRKYCKASKHIPSNYVRVQRRKGEGPEHSKGKLLTLNAIRRRFVIKEPRTKAELRCWREKTINHGLRPDVYCENDAIVIGEVKVFKRAPHKPSEVEGVTQLVRYYRYVVSEGLNNGRPVKAVLVYYVPRKDIQISEEICEVLKEVMMLALMHGDESFESLTHANVEDDFIVLEIRSDGYVKKLCQSL